MRPLPTPEQMSAADAKAIAVGTTGAVLMDRAGRAVARTVIRLLGGRYGRRVAIVCGTGNNGGDGFVIARVLMNEGVSVRCALVGDRDSVTGDAKHHLGLLLGAGGRVESFADASLSGADVIVDALFGTGFRGVAEGDAANTIEAINRHPAPTVAVDIPSGVDGAMGAARGPVIKAHTTVAIGAQKLGTAVGIGAELSGDVEIVDIGIGVDDTDAWLSTSSDVDAVVPRRSAGAHKRSVGSVAILGGSEGMSGAAILAARAAVRMGAGYATVGLPRSIDAIVSTALPEVLTVALTDEPQLTEEAVPAFKSVLDRTDVVAIGPGLGDGDAQQRLVQRVLRETPQSVVIDADGLNVLARDTSVLGERSAPTILTPHPAELARLLQTDTDAVQQDRIAAVREAAQRFDCVVVLKGSRSLIAAPGNKLVVNDTGSAQLATAGTGDVLTGAVTALVAAGCDAFDAAWAAVHLHGIAGEVAAARHDGYGVVAWDVAEALPEALACVELVG